MNALLQQQNAILKGLQQKSSAGNVSESLADVPADLPF